MNLPFPKAKKTKDCVIVTGCGSDMSVVQQQRLYHAVAQNGFPRMFPTHATAII